MTFDDLLIDAEDEHCIAAAILTDLNFELGHPLVAIDHDDDGYITFVLVVTCKPMAEEELEDKLQLFINDVAIDGYPYA